MGIGSRLGLALGLMFASLELAVLAFGPFRPGPGSIGWIVGADVLAALLLSVVAERLGGGDEVDQAGRAAATTAFALVAAYVAPGIALVASEGQWGAILLVAVPALVAVAAWVGARRIARWGRADAVLTVAVGVAALTAAVAPFASGPRSTVERERPSVVVITVDGLRADAVPDALAALTAGGVRFTDAVTPTTGSRAANAAVMTGLHPLRTAVLGPRDRLSRAYPTLFEALSEEGWATAAFGSSSAVGRGSGLTQGFGTFDDGWTRAQDSAVARLVVGLWVRLLDRDGVGGWSAREDARTAQRFADWARSRPTPFAAWIQLADPHRVELGALDAPTTAEAARIIGSALPANALVIVVGTHGELGGAHGGRGAATLYDEVVHVPLAIRFPGEPPAVPEVSAQVRTLDLVATVFDVLKIESDTETEGLPLTGYASGARQASVSCALVGPDLDGTWLVGVRANRVKVVERGGEEALYLLDRDPGETTDQAAAQPGALAQVRALLASDRAALTQLGR